MFLLFSNAMAALGFASFLLCILLPIGGALAQNDGNLTFEDFSEAAINQNYRIGAEIIQIHCLSSAQHRNDTTYHFISAPQDFFVIDSETGSITLRIAALDLPRFGVYSVPVYCKLGLQIAIADLNIHYQERNEFVPVFQNSLLEVWISEDRNITSNPLVVQLNATDEDLGNCGEIQYGFLSGNEAGVFALDPISGTLTLTSTLNHENAPEYILRIRAENVECRISHARIFAQVRVKVHVTDINDEGPQFEKKVYNISLIEGERYSNFLQISCTDLDTAASAIAYFPLNLIHPFSISAESGELSTVDSLDYESHSSYTLYFACRDLSHSDLLEDTTTVYIEVEPVNEYPPVTQAQAFLVVINQTLEAGTLIASTFPNSGALVEIVLSDQDLGSDHGKSNFRLTTESDHDKFLLDASTGNLTLITPINKELQCTDNFTPMLTSVQMEVCDAPQTRSNQQCFSIHIDLFSLPADCVPSFLRDSYEIRMRENTPVNSVLQHIPCGTPGLAGTGRFTLEITSEVNEFFSIDDDGALRSIKNVDYEVKQSFHFFLECTDLNNNSAIAAVNVHIIPENDNIPLFERPLYIFNITDFIISTPFTIGEIRAKDLDLDAGNALTYNILSNQPYFTINKTDGTLSLLSLPDDPLKDTFVFEIEVTDGQFTDITTALVILSYRAQEALQVGTDEVCGTICFMAIGILLAVLVIISVFSIILAGCFVFQKRTQLKVNTNAVITTSTATGYSHLNHPNNKLSSDPEKGQVNTAVCQAYMHHDSHERSEEMASEELQYHYVTTEQISLQVLRPPIPTPRDVRSQDPMQREVHFEEETLPSHPTVSSEESEVTDPKCSSRSTCSGAIFDSEEYITMRSSSAPASCNIQRATPTMEHKESGFSTACPQPYEEHITHSMSVENIYEHIQ